MKVSFPAMRGEIGQRVYYSCLMKLNAIRRCLPSGIGRSSRLKTVSKES
jgi:hypothetical protein